MSLKQVQLAICIVYWIWLCTAHLLQMEAVPVCLGADPALNTAR